MAINRSSRFDWVVYTVASFSDQTRGVMADVVFIAESIEMLSIRIVDKVSDFPSTPMT